MTGEKIVQGDIELTEAEARLLVERIESITNTPIEKFLAEWSEAQRRVKSQAKPTLLGSQYAQGQKTYTSVQAIQAKPRQRYTLERLLMFGMITVTSLIVAGAVIILLNVYGTLNQPLETTTEPQTTAASNFLTPDTPLPSPTDAPPFAIAKNIAGETPIRSGPGVDFSQVGSLAPYETILVIACSPDRNWYKVQLPGVESAWIWADYVSLSTDGDATFSGRETACTQIDSSAAIQTPTPVTAQ
jgi:hypothetical protein